MTTTSNPAGEKTLVITRIFDAPRELVFEAWTDPKHVAKWWGPKYFTNPVCEIDPRPGGTFYVVMTGPDGVAYPGKGVFLEVVPPERLVFTTTGVEDEAGIPQLDGLNTVTFEEYQGKTRLTLHATVRVGQAAAFALEGMEPGWNQSLDKLDELLAHA